MWFRATKATIANGGKVVAIIEGDDISLVQEKAGLIFEGQSPVEIKRGYIDGTGAKFIELVDEWPYSSQSQQPAVSFPTDASFAEATAELRRVIDNFQIASTQDAEKGTDDTKTMTPLKTKQAIDYTINQEIEHIKEIQPYPWAMRKVDFERQRQNNREKYVSGVVEYGKQNKTELSVKQGLYQYSNFTTSSQVNNILMGRAGSESAADSESRTDGPVLCISGVLFNFTTFINGAYEQVRIYFEEAEKGLTTYDPSTKAVVKHATSELAFASETDTNKVLVNRVDLMGVEVWLRKITPEDPYVYIYGAIQCTSGTLDGLTPRPLTDKAQSYFSWYNGDTNTVGRGFNWEELSEDDKKKLASNPLNNIYYDDEDNSFYQWCVRGVTKGGAKNGDWENLDTLITALANSTYLRVPIKANNDTVEDWVDSGSNNHYYGRKGQGVHYTGEFTAFSGDGTARYAAHGQAYFLPLFTVNRLNQGLYHPSYNPSGTAIASDGKSFLDTTVTFASTRDCFNPSKLQANSGSIESGKSGRFDGKYHDSLWIEGFSGVCNDVRYSSRTLSLSDFVKADQKAKSGKYRGFERIVYTTPLLENYLGDSNIDSKKVLRVNGAVGNLSNGEDRRLSGYLVLSDNTIIKYTRVRHMTNVNQTYFYTDIPQADPTPNWTGTFHVMLTNRFDSSIASEYLQMDVVGTPQRILSCDDLKDGWLGSWIPELPDGSKDRFSLTRPLKESDKITKYQTDNGDTWTKDTNVSVNKNVPDASLGTPPATRVIFLIYTSKTVITSPDSRSTLLTGPESFISGVYAYSRGDMTGFGGRDLGFSMIGTMTNSNSGTREQILTLQNIGINMETGVPAGGSVISPSTHGELSLYGVAGTKGYKVSSYASTGINATEAPEGPIGYGQLYYSYTELTHDGTDWGDDQKINIIDWSGTYLDQNGNKNAIGTAKIVDKLGWVRYGS